MSADTPTAYFAAPSAGLANLPGPPTREGQTAEVGPHAIDAVPSKLPRDALVWECQHCNKRRDSGMRFWNLACEEES